VFESFTINKYIFCIERWDNNMILTNKTDKITEKQSKETKFLSKIEFTNKTNKKIKR